LKKIGHKEGKQRKMNDAEIMLIGFYCHEKLLWTLRKGIAICQKNGLCEFVLGKSRFNRWLHFIEDLMHQIFLSFGDTLKQFNTSMEYISSLLNK
jgi:hypothetical protein